MLGLERSLLQFEEATRSQEHILHNLKSLYQVSLSPSDTYFRERLDPLFATQLQPAINGLQAN